MGPWIRHQLGRRPAWMNILMLFCAYMTFVYMPWDLFVKPTAIDEEVWFGVRFHGTTAKWLAVPHWFVYAAGLVGFWGMRSWMVPWAAVYLAQVAFSMLVWPILYVGGFTGAVVGLISGAVFMMPTAAMWNSREHFGVAPSPLTERYGSWALVTGASAGIGREFARALARDGMSLVLCARREEELEALATELQTGHGVETRVVPADLSTAAGIELLLAQIDDLEIAMLVNNAGFGYSGRFDLQDRERLQRMVQLNCAAPVALTAELLPRMRERGRGAVIFTGSVAGLQPLPLHALYSATKAFDNLLAEGLWGELHGSGIDVLALEPGSTESEFHDVAGELPHAGARADDVVEAALRTLGHAPAVIPGWFDWLRGNAAYRLLPRSTLALVAKAVMRQQTPEEMR